jgi:hypothetical protein
MESTCILAFVRAVLFWGLLLLLTRPGSACTCVPSALEPFCAVPLNGESAVFIGNVTSVATDGTKHSREVHLTLEERIHGDRIGSEIVVFTGMGDGDCGVRFEVGANYLVVADLSPDGVLSTSICDRTQKIEDLEASPDLRALRAWRDHEIIRGWVFGGVTKTDVAIRIAIHVAARTGEEFKPMGGVLVQLRAGRSSREVSTDAQGRFSIEGLEPRKYKVYVALRGWRLFSWEHYALRRDPIADLTVNPCARLDPTMEPVR